MPLTFNLRQVETKTLQLDGELPAAELDVQTDDEMLQIREPLQYHLELEKLEDAVLVQGSLSLMLDCQCVRCLKPFQYPLSLDHWACHLALEGEEQAVVANDCVDLTPYLREDIFLAFPQHPLCTPDCRGLPRLQKKLDAGDTVAPDRASPWTELDKLKL